MAIDAHERAVGAAAADVPSAQGRGDQRWACCAVVVSLQTICARCEIGWGAPLTGVGLGGLAEEQAALRRVATLVARGAPPSEVFSAVTEEVALLLVAEMSNMVRYEPDGAFTIVGSVGSVGVLSKHWTGAGLRVTQRVEHREPEPLRIALLAPH